MDPPIRSKKPRKSRKMRDKMVISYAISCYKNELFDEKDMKKIAAKMSATSRLTGSKKCEEEEALKTDPQPCGIAGQGRNKDRAR